MQKVSRSGTRYWSDMVTLVKPPMAWPSMGYLAIQRPFQLGGGDGHILQLAQHIHELHPDELDIFFLHNAGNILLVRGTKLTSFLFAGDAPKGASTLSIIDI